MLGYDRNICTFILGYTIARALTSCKLIKKAKDIKTNRTEVAHIFSPTVYSFSLNFFQEYRLLNNCSG